jgi:hypothetical protein
MAEAWVVSEKVGDGGPGDPVRLIFDAIANVRGRGIVNNSTGMVQLAGV